MAYKKIMAAAFAVTLFLAGCAGSTDKGTSQAAVPLKETMNPISVRQLVAADNEHNRTIMFQLLKSVEAFVEYREKGNDRIFSVSAKGAALKGNNGITDSYIYTAELTDLKKGTAYEYRTRTGNTVSGWMDFRTDDGGAFKAVIYPDSQSADYTGWSKLATKAYELNKDAALFISMGDLVDNGQDEYQWQAWMRSMKGIMDTIPGAVMMGNHEDYSLDWKMAKPDRYLAHFHLPNNGDADYKDHFYSFDWGDVHFTVLDTQLNELKEWYPDLFEREKKWAADDLARTDKKWKVVLMHKDPLQYAFAGREGREEGFSRKDRNLCLSLMQAMWIWFCLPICIRIGIADAFMTSGVRKQDLTISLPGWPGMCAIRDCGKHIHWTSILHHSRKPIITLSWKREKMFLLLQAILRTGRKCISPL